jgi:hypothetical protein
VTRWYHAGTVEGYAYGTAVSVAMFMVFSWVAGVQSLSITVVSAVCFAVCLLIGGRESLARRRHAEQLESFGRAAVRLMGSSPVRGKSTW